MTKEELIGIIKKYVRGVATPGEELLLKRYDGLFDVSSDLHGTPDSDTELEHELFSRIKGKIDHESNRG